MSFNKFCRVLIRQNLKLNFTVRRCSHRIADNTRWARSFLSSFSIKICLKYGQDAPKPVVSQDQFSFAGEDYKYCGNFCFRHKLCRHFLVTWTNGQWQERSRLSGPWLADLFGKCKHHVKNDKEKSPSFLKIQVFNSSNSWKIHSRLKYFF